VQIPLDREKPVPLARQIQAHLERLIAGRLLAPGVKLPATRELAQSLGVNRATVALAYEELVAAGADPVRIAQNVYFANPESKMRLLGAALSSLQRKDKLVWMHVSDAQMNQLSALEEDCEGLVNYALSIAGVELIGRDPTRSRDSRGAHFGDVYPGEATAGGFTVAEHGDSHAQIVAGPGPIAALDSILMLQGMEDSTQGK